MKKYLFAIAASTFLIFSLNASAAKPISITFQSNETTPDGVEYSNYIVKCSNGQKQPITAWNKRKKWCVGESTENCSKKQITTAKQACKAS